MYNPIKPYKKEILSAIQSTWRTPYVNVHNGVYPVIRKKFSELEIDHTDGIGTKGVYHWQKQTFYAAVLDALAMNLNDLALARATPYKIQNHLTLPQENGGVLKIIRHLAAECHRRKIAMTGGENSFHDNAEGLEISITMSGFIKNPRTNRFRIGDTLIGLASNGLHSNGFTKVRQLFKKDFRPDFIKPTAIYLDAISETARRFPINGMMHITGGAFSKLKDLLPRANAVISRHSLKPHKIFQEIFSHGVKGKEMYGTFNCGVGFVLSSTPSNVSGIIKILKKRGFRAAPIGHIEKGTDRVYIESLFSQDTIEL